MTDGGGPSGLAGMMATLGYALAMVTALLLVGDILAICTTCMGAGGWMSGPPGASRFDRLGRGLGRRRGLVTSGTSVAPRRPGGLASSMSVNSGLRPVRLFRFGLLESTQLAAAVSSFSGLASIGLGRFLRAHTRRFLTSSDAFPSLLFYFIPLLPSLVEGNHSAQVEGGRSKIVGAGKILRRSHR